MYYGVGFEARLRSRGAMPRLIRELDRLLPPLLMASGVMLLTAGLLAFAVSSAGQGASPTPLPIGDPLLPIASSSPTAAGPSPIAIGSSAGPAASLPPTGPRAFASRIVIPSLNVDLPVIAGDSAVPGNEDLYPLCDVAMFLPGFVQPGEPGTTYIYAHAQRGMFLPLLRASLVDDGSALVGALVEVYTTADEVHVYQITTVKRHATDLSIASDATGTEQLVLQTSEGPTGTVPKLQIAARPVSTVPASPAEAQPSAEPRVCLPPTAAPS
jgi:sortase (surface protein transpeptidase)